MPIERIPCRHCGRPVGAYEPIYAGHAGAAERTSWLALDGEVRRLPLWHAACYEAAMAAPAEKRTVA